MLLMPALAESAGGYVAIGGMPCFSNSRLNASAISFCCANDQPHRVHQQFSVCSPW